MTLPSQKKPCRECPWRKDNPPGKFPPERFRALASTAYDLARTVFACHMSKEGGEVGCAGFILQAGGHNLIVRLARVDRAEFSSDVPLYENYVEMAVANGVDRDDPALKPVRID